MNKENFTLDRVVRKDEHEDYWFKTDKISDKELSDKYMEMCMIGVTEVVYSKDEDIVGIKRQFPFNYDVVLSDDEDLKRMLNARIDEENRQKEIAKQKASIEKELKSEIEKMNNMALYEKMAKELPENPRLAELVNALKELGE